MLLLFLLLSPIVVTSSTLPNAILSESDYDKIVVIPDTHGDLEAAILSVWLAYSKFVPIESQTSRNAFKDAINKAVKFWGKLTADQVEAKERLPDTYRTINLPEPPQKIALIQLGDLVDRGPYSRECIDLFEIIEPVLGWTVLRLYGNHDVLTMMDDPLRYIHIHDLTSWNDGVAVSELSLAPNPKRMKAFHKGGAYFQKYIQSFLGMAKWSSNRGSEINTLFVHAGISFDWFDKVRDLQIEGLVDVCDETRMEQDPNWINNFNSAIRNYIDSPMN